MRREPLEIEVIAANLRYLWKRDKNVIEASLQEALDNVSDDTLALVFDDYVEALEVQDVVVDLMKDRMMRATRGVTG